jgi:hypothetical protein
MATAVSNQFETREIHVRHIHKKKKQIKIKKKLLK